MTSFFRRLISLDLKLDPAFDLQLHTTNVRGGHFSFIAMFSYLLGILHAYIYNVQDIMIAA